MEKMTDEEIMAVLARIANERKETDTNISIVLFALLGALLSGHDKELAAICKGFSIGVLNYMDYEKWLKEG